MENFDFLNSLVFPYVNWIIFLILATIVLRKSFVNALASKRSAYAELLLKANLAKEEAELQNSELKSRLSKLDREIDEIRTQAIHQAEQEAKALVRGAEQLAEHIEKEARRIAEAEVASAKLALQKEVLEQVRIHTAEHIKKNLDGAAHLRVNRQGLVELKSPGVLS